MIDLSRPWPLGLGEKRWWIAVGGAIALLGMALRVRPRVLAVRRKAGRAPLRDVLAQVTPYGEFGLDPDPGRRALRRHGAGGAGRALEADADDAVAVHSALRLHLPRRRRAQPVHRRSSSASSAAGGRCSTTRPGLFGFRFNWWDWTYQSFPSGHATVAFALAAVVGFISERWFYPGLLFGAAVALSRVTEGVHYPSDVIAGADRRVCSALHACAGPVRPAAAGCSSTWRRRAHRGAIAGVAAALPHAQAAR